VARITPCGNIFSGITAVPHSSFSKDHKPGGKCKKKERTRLLVCTEGKHCSRLDSEDVLKVLRKTIEKCELDNVLKVKKSDCLGLCKHGPVVSVESHGVCYGGVTEADCKDIIERHVEKAKPIKRLHIHKKGKKRK
jgi:(2Fe-2S) ferredoxin